MSPPANSFWSRLPQCLLPLDAAPRGEPWNLAELADLIPPQQRRMPAAVLVALVPRPSGTAVLLTRRTDHLSRHPGQVSFPGGRADAGDLGPVGTALREAQEEVGIAPGLIEPLGFLDRYDTITAFRVTPVVARLAAEYEAHPDADEVADVFEVPLSWLRDPARRERHEREYAGRMRHYFQFRYGPHTIWGATAAILVNLTDRLAEID